MSLNVFLYIKVDVGAKDLKRINLYDSNITHNLTAMAKEAGIYKQLWRPEEVGAKYAKDIVNAVEVALIAMKENPELFRKFDPPNGWGTYEGFIHWVEKYLDACKENPKALIEVNR